MSPREFGSKLFRTVGHLIQWVPALLALYYVVWPLPAEEFKLPAILGGAAALYTGFRMWYLLDADSMNAVHVISRDAAVALSLFWIVMMIVLSGEIMRQTAATIAVHGVIVENSILVYKVLYGIQFCLIFFFLLTLVGYLRKAWLFASSLRNAPKQSGV